MRKIMYDMVRRFEFLAHGELLTIIYFFFLRLFSKCKKCYDGYFYPQYGIAPHYHDFPIDKNGNKVIAFIGSTRVLPKKEWPDCYDDVDEGAGIWYCEEENCEFNKKNAKRKTMVYNRKRT